MFEVEVARSSSGDSRRREEMMNILNKKKTIKYLVEYK